METQLVQLIKGVPDLLDFPMTVFIVWAGLRVWREAKELITTMDQRNLGALQEITEKSDQALQRVTEGMRSIREEVRVMRAELGGRLRNPSMVDLTRRMSTSPRRNRCNSKDRI